MAVCERCGAPMDDGALTCPVCNGAGVDPQDAEQNKVMAILAYIIFLVPLLAAKESPFARFHTNQGLVLFIVALALNILNWIPFVNLIAWVLSLGVLALMIIGIVNAAKGEMKPLPLIGNIKLLK